MKRIYSILVLWCMAALSALAQNYTLTGSVDPVVHVGQNFRLKYTLNTTDAKNFTLGSLPDALDVLIGPSQSTSISSVYVNGHSQTSQTMTLTYVLSASKEGKFTIPPARVTAGGQTIQSEPLTLQVIAGNEPQTRGGTQNSGRGKDFFILATATKRRVTEYEPFLLTYKVCWHPDLPVTNLDNISLELQNVYMQAYNDTQQKSKKVETINGRVLLTVDWVQYVVYPQKPGKLTIPAQKMKGYVREDVAFDPFDPFTAGYREVTQMLTAPALDIQVDALPDKPADFSGGVGHFSISAMLDKDQVKENAPVTLQVKVSGRGNLNMLKEPVVLFPKGFDTYDTKQTENFKLTSEGLNGEVNYEFVAVPQRRGKFIIPPASFTYYDNAKHSYLTLKTDSFQLEVLPGEGGAAVVSDYVPTGGDMPGDIRPIRTGTQRAVQSHGFFASTLYFVIMAVLLLSFVLLFIFLQSRASGKADVVGTRGKRANSVAVRRLRKAAKLMKAGKASEFYDETLRALWGYVGDKLNIPVSQLSRENISQRLQERGVDEQITSRFIEALDECEFVRYAPGDPQGNMRGVYEKSITAIEQIESMKKSVKKSAKTLLLSMPLILVSVLSIVTVPALAQDSLVVSSAPSAQDSLAVNSAPLAPDKVKADELYNQGYYEQAIEAYATLLSKGSDATLLYNMGNAYYRLGELPQAILAYERALQLQPGDDDVCYNLQLARSKTIDKIAPEREMFFITWYRALVNMVSVDAWGWVTIAAFACALILLLVYFFAYAERLRRVSFFTALLMLVIFALGILFAWQQKQQLERRDAAIVIQEELGVKKIPSDGGGDEFTIHAGTKVNISDDSMDDWKQILLPDGRQGWVQTKALEVI